MFSSAIGSCLYGIRALRASCINEKKQKNKSVAGCVSKRVSIETRASITTNTNPNLKHSITLYMMKPFKSFNCTPFVYIVSPANKSAAASPTTTTTTMACYDTIRS